MQTDYAHEDFRLFRERIIMYIALKTSRLRIAIYEKMCYNDGANDRVDDYAPVLCGRGVAALTNLDHTALMTEHRGARKPFRPRYKPGLRDPYGIVVASRCVRTSVPNLSDIKGAYARSSSP